ncbi:hypothetical protein EYF80_019695 [Liparis tanakae]|uniref:Uncharacterized protein n=1 Tax=Liparis tanakae TaxID=230148 RepID=A0A4Z2HW00_9TELE|nr:hypothetical protein EYF80_019695 [Liparis tanakae]
MQAGMQAGLCADGQAGGSHQSCGLGKNRLPSPCVGCPSPHGTDPEARPSPTGASAASHTEPSDTQSVPQSAKAASRSLRSPVPPRSPSQSMPQLAGMPEPLGVRMCDEPAWTVGAFSLSSRPCEGTSESERYRKDSLRWLWGKVGWSTDPGLACESMGLRPGEGPFSESKLRDEHKHSSLVSRRGGRWKEVVFAKESFRLVGGAAEPLCMSEPKGPFPLSQDRDMLLRTGTNERSVASVHNCTCRERRRCSEMSAGAPEYCGSVSGGGTKPSPRVLGPDRPATRAR